MPDFILIDGDTVSFLPTFGPAIVVVKPGTLKGSGPATIGGKKVCVVGDETKVEVPGCMYIAGAFVVPGTGILTIDSLAGDQKTTKTKSGGKKVLLRDCLDFRFEGERDEIVDGFCPDFEVRSPATGRESGTEDAARSLAQPKNANLNSL